MAKITAVYDSETKALTVDIDGVDQGTISYFSCYNECYGEEMCGGCRIEHKPVKENGVTYNQSAYAHCKTDKEKLDLYFRDALTKK